jgi:DNA-binding IclR family transcriptional regulator
MVPAVTSAIRVLTELSQTEGRGATAAELVRETGISKSTMHNLLATLESEGFVRASAATRHYHLGGALIPLGKAAAQHVELLTLAAHELPRLALEHGLSMAVGQLTPDGGAQIIDRAYPAQPVHVGIRLGSRYGYFDGAIGKCLLASLEPERAELIIRSEPIPAHTERTITDPARLLEEVRESRRRGWAASIGEYNRNIAVASPISGEVGIDGLLLALGFPEDVPADDVPLLGASLKDVADWIASQAGAPSPDGRVGQDGEHLADRPGPVIASSQGKRNE